MNASTLERIARTIRSVRYGTAQIVIQDARVIRLEKTEKIRLDQADQTTGGLADTHSFADQTTGSEEIPDMTG